VVEQALREGHSIDREVPSTDSSPLFYAMASRQSSPAAPSAVAQHSKYSSRSPDQDEDRARSATRSLNYPEIHQADRAHSISDPGEPSSSDGPPVGSSFAASVLRKEWRAAGPPSAPAYGEEPAGFSSAQNRQRQRAGGGTPGGPLADSVASLTMSVDRPPGRHAYSSTPAEIFPTLQPIADEDEGGSERPACSAAKKEAEGGADRAGLSPSIARRRSSGNPFKDEECSVAPGRSSAKRSASGNPFAVGSDGDARHGISAASQSLGVHSESYRETEVHWPCVQPDPVILQVSPTAGSLTQIC
jgi:hypothetical protein